MTVVAGADRQPDVNAERSRDVDRDAALRIRLEALGRDLQFVIAGVQPGKVVQAGGPAGGRARICGGRFGELDICPRIAAPVVSTTVPVNSELA